MSDPSRSASHEKIEEFRRKVREMRRGGDLDALLSDGAEELLQAFREEMLAERARTSSAEEGFPPSPLPQVPGEAPLEPGTEAAPGDDAGR